MYALVSIVAMFLQVHLAELSLRVCDCKLRLFITLLAPADSCCDVSANLLPLNLLLPAAVCRKWAGELHGAEGQQLSWVTARQLHDYAMPAADVPLVPPVLEAMAGRAPAS